MLQMICLQVGGGEVCMRMVHDDTMDIVVLYIVSLPICT